MLEAVVIGAGINGLCAAYQLRRRGLQRLAVLEQFTLGHGRGSSHGQSRITRSTYSTQKYVELVQLAHDEEWPGLAAQAGKTLLHPSEGVFFGPHLEPYKQSLQAVPEVFARIDLLTPQEGRKAFPHFLFPDSADVIRDRTCALVAAQDTMQFLASQLQDCLRENCQVASLESTPGAVVVHTNQGKIECERLILAGGPWTDRLVPQLKTRLRVAHQDVGYASFAQPHGLGDFPVWVYCGEGQEGSFYGLPQFGRPGVKMARHRTGLHSDDPDRPLSPTIPPEAREELEAFARQQFAFPVTQVGYEACLYTNTVLTDFLLDHLPGEPRIVVAAGFSGHGFKFGPLTGRILAELLLDGKTSVAPFERYREQFQFSALPEWPCRADA